MTTNQFYHGATKDNQINHEKMVNLDTSCKCVGWNGQNSC